MPSDIILYLPPGEESESQIIDQASGFAISLEAQLTGLAVATNYNVHPNWLAGVAGVSRLAAEENERSQVAASSALAAFEKTTRERGVFGGKLLASADFGMEGDMIAARCRGYDLCLLPASREPRRMLVEDVLFGAGRGVLLFEPGVADLPTKLDVVVVAWDGSRCAARAMNDALPMLRKSRLVKVLSVLNDKADMCSGVGATAVRHLTAHGVKAEPFEIDATGGPTGIVLDAAVRNAGADLLVMGAFGSSRLREFVLGGATSHVLKHLQLATFLSH